jgi:hypothetical protein
MQDFPELAVEAEKFINQWYKSESANANGENPSTGTKPPTGPEPYVGEATSGPKVHKGTLNAIEGISNIPGLSVEQKKIKIVEYLRGAGLSYSEAGQFIDSVEIK